MIWLIDGQLVDSVSQDGRAAEEAKANATAVVDAAREFAYFLYWKWSQPSDNPCVVVAAADDETANELRERWVRLMDRLEDDFHTRELRR